jgi:hypothetical protein
MSRLRACWVTQAAVVCTNDLGQDRASALPGEVGAARIQPQQHGRCALGGHRSGISVQDGDASGRGVEGVGIASTRESSRTRAVAVAGTSRTVSPRASSHWERWRPSPRRSSPPTVAHRSALPRSTACGSRAGGLDPDPTSIAEAVWLDLCGSMPITITETCPSGERESIAGAPWSTIRLQPGSRSHTSVESGHGSCRARPQTPGEPTRTGRQEAHERSRARHLRQATTSEHPVRRTGAPIQVGSSAQVCPVSGGVRVDPLLCGAPSPDHPAVTGSIG